MYAFVVYKSAIQTFIKMSLLCLEKHEGVIILFYYFFWWTIPLSNGEKYSLNTAALDCKDGFITACHNDEINHWMVWESGYYPNLSQKWGKEQRYLQRHITEQHWKHFAELCWQKNNSEGSTKKLTDNTKP